MENSVPHEENLDNLEFALSELAREFYIDLPYHNFEHATHTLDVSLALTEYCEENELSVNRKVIIASALLHDANFHIPIEDHGFRSKEEYSAQIAAEVLPNLGYENDEIAHVQSSIRSTERNIECESLEAKIIRRADLDNLTGSLPELMQNSWKLWLEAWQLSGGSLSLKFDDWMCGIHTNLQAYFDEDVSFGEFDEVNGRSAFLAAALRNIEKIDVLVRGQTLGLVTKSWETLIELRESTIDALVARVRKTK